VFIKISSPQNHLKRKMLTTLGEQAQALGLQRDGANFKNLTPYEIEMRRRVWVTLCMLDVRASEDQGMEYTIPLGTFDTKLPLNINDSDIEPDAVQMPAEREGITDMTFPLVSAEIMETSKQMMTKGAKDGLLGIEGQSRLLSEMYQNWTDVISDIQLSQVTLHTGS
jgi:hypothetical protein